MPFTIDPEFQSLIPPLKPEERTELERSIEREGCRDPLVVWSGQDILLDGHNRYAICQKLGKPFNTTGLSFPDRDAAKVWIIENQFARRNLAPYQRAELEFAREKILKRRAAENIRATQANAAASAFQKSGKQIHVDRELARAAGLSHDTIHKARVIAEKAPEEIKEKLRAGEESINAVYTKIRQDEREQRREERRRENSEKIAEAEEPSAILGQAKFATIVIDPPWDWGDEGDINQLGRAKADYATMPIGDIERLPVPDLADEDCHLYLWITNRSLPKGFRLIESWGFRYITCLTWIKPSPGMGNYFRGSTEQILFAVKGSQPLRRKDVGTWFSADRPGGHSTKPDEFFRLVESCSPGPYAELFQRKNREGWFGWGENSALRLQ